MSHRKVQMTRKERRKARRSTHNNDFRGATPEKCMAYLKSLEFSEVIVDPKLPRAVYANRIRQIAQGFANLSKITRIPESVLSLGGMLTLQIGITAEKGAIAQYCPKDKLLTFFKKVDTCVIGHEWFHSLDSLLGAVFGVQMGTDLQPKSTILHFKDVGVELKDLLAHLNPLSKDIEKSCRLKKNGRDPLYWAHLAEVAARSFEAYLMLRGAALGVRCGGEEEINAHAWAFPSSDQSEAMAFHFDRLCEALARLPKTAFRVTQVLPTAA